MASEATTGNTALNATEVHNCNSDSNLPLIIGISASGAAVLIIICIALTILLCKRRKRARLKSESFQHGPDSVKVKTADNGEACTKAETSRVAEPYSVVTLNEYTTTTGITVSRKVHLTVDGNGNTKNAVASPPALSEPGNGSGSIVDEYNETGSAEVILKRYDVDDSLRSVNSIPGENNTWKKDHFDNLQEPGRPTLSELYSKGGTSQHTTGEKEHIYFVLEPESITENHKENTIHQ